MIRPVDPIAIIGLSGRFPGAGDTAQFWHMLMSGREGIRRLSDAELRSAGVPDALCHRPDFVAAEPVLDDIDLFDAEFFGLSPRDATALTPAMRLFLECCWEAFENAAIDPTPDHGAIGVFGSANLSQYWRLGAAGFDPSLEAILGNDKDYIASQVAYRLDLKGPAISVQTACSSSLVAVHLACQALATGACDLALAGGAAVRVPAGQGYLFEAGSILSPDGHCRPFDAAHSGPVFGSGVGAVLLKPLAAAIRDGDPIRAVIRGSAVNNDGSLKAGFAAPGLEGQAAVIKAALEAAGVAPEEVSYIEAHGTGTALGDPVEVAALTRVFGPGRAGGRRIVLGAVKGNVGHLETAAGVTGLIKTVLALEAEALPPTLHYKTPNPDLDISATPFEIDAQPRPWPRADQPRRAGVSSFGMGGTNAHLVLEEAPRVVATPHPDRPELILLSARSPAALARIGQRLSSFARMHKNVPVADIAYTLAKGRRRFEWRRAVVASDITSLKLALAATEIPTHAAEKLCAIGFDLTEPLTPAMLETLTGESPEIRETLRHPAPDPRQQSANLTLALAGWLATGGIVPDRIRAAPGLWAEAAVLAGVFPRDAVVFGSDPARLAKLSASAGIAVHFAPDIALAKGGRPDAAFWMRVLSASSSGGSDGDDDVIWVGLGASSTGLSALPTQSAPAPEPGRQALLRLAGTIWCRGGRIDTNALNGSPAPRRHPMPTYPFQRSRYWHQMPDVVTSPAATPVVIEPASAVPAGQAPHDPAAIPAAVAEVVALALMIPVGKLDRGRSFIDLGADSLVLIEISQTLKRRFGIEITVAQIFEQLTDTDRLAAHVARLASDPTNPRSTSVPPTVEARPVVPRPAAADITREVARILPRVADATDAELPDPRKQAHLERLIAAYTARTCGSKRLAQQKRPILADTRSSAGFKMYLKEMLYSIIVDRGEGAHVVDVDGNRYIDVTMGFGCRLFGHDTVFMRAAMATQLDRDVPLGPENPEAGVVAEIITRLTGAERIGIFSTGTEAVMTALRVARAKSGREGIALFKGSYHGHADLVLGVGLEGGQVAPLSSGVPADVVGKLTILDYGEDAALHRIEAQAATLAAVLVEPVQSRFPDRQPVDFLRKLRLLCDRLDIALIFDEMITGFRIGPGGAQDWCGVQADLVTYGKIVGNGLPIGVVAGKAAWLDYLDGGAWGFGDRTSPSKPSVFYAGTFNKNPWTMCAARATLAEIEARGPTLYTVLNMKTARLACRLNAYFVAGSFPIEVVHFASLFRFRIQSNADLFFLHLNLRGIYVWEGRNCFLSDAHTDDDIEAIFRAACEAAEAMRDDGFFDAAPAKMAEVLLTRGQMQVLIAEATARHAAQAYTIPLVVEISGGDPDMAVLEHALARVIARHEALRTIFVAADQPAQVFPFVWPELTVARFGGLRADEAARAAMAQLIDAGFAADAPPIKALLCGVDTGRWQLMLALRHVGADGISLEILLQDLAAEYDALARHMAAERSEAAAFSAHAGWLDGLRATPDWGGHLEFWRDRLRDPPQGPSLSMRDGQAVDHTAESLRLHLPAELSGALGKAAKAQGATVFALCLAVAQAVLHRITGDEDLVLGIPVTGRGGPLSRKVVGFCTHLLPLRSGHPEDAVFADYLAASRRDLLRAMAHQDVPFAEILDALNLPRDPARPPLLSVTFNMDQPAPIPDMGGLSLRLIPPEVRYSTYPLALNITDLPDGLVLECRFQTARHDRAAMARLLDQYVAFLTAVIQNPLARVQSIALDDCTVQAQAALSVPMAGIAHGPCLQRIAAIAGVSPDAAAVIEGGTQTSYQALITEAEAMAHALLAAGLGKGDVLAIDALPSARLIAAVLAAGQIGAVFVLLDPAHGAGRHQLIVKESGAKAVLVLEAKAVAADMAATLHWVRTPKVRKALLPKVMGDDPACIFFTSGSTGAPKGLVGRHGAIAQFVDWQGRTFGVTAQDRVAHLTAVSFDAVLRDIFLPLCHGAAIVIPPEGLVQNPAAVPGWLHQNDISIVHAVPSRVQGWLAAPGCELVKLRHLFLSGEPLSNQVIRRWHARFGPAAQVVNFYGSTETTMIRAFSCVNGYGSTNLFSPIEATQIHVLRGDLPCAVGEPGEIVVRTPYRTGGALKGGVSATFATNPYLADDWLYRSGDLGRLAPDGRIEVLGRMDDQVKINGVRVEPAAIKAVLDQDSAIADSVVLTRPGADGALHLYAWVIAAKASGVLVPHLRQVLYTRLGAAFVPQGIAVLAAFPLLPNGKVDRAALVTPAETLREIVPPRTDHEAKVAAIWAEVLGISVGAECDVFSLGANSLSATQALSRLRRDFGANLDLRVLFDLPTPAALAAHLANAVEDVTETL